MSTRTQILFVKPNEDAAQVYQHADGYPKGVLPHLAELRDVQNESRTHRTAGYTAANYIFAGKMRCARFNIRDPNDEHARESDLRTSKPSRALDVSEYANFNQPASLLGYGISEIGTLHGDEEYAYKVFINSHDSDDWGVQVGRASGFGISKFDNVSWCNSMSLEKAISEYAE
jgi:hypothetical protein